jgi:hypothetical protein
MSLPEWLSPRKLQDYYVETAVPDPDEAQKQIYEAVISGKVRARRKGLVLGPEWLKQIAQLKVDEANPFALPPDIELSVEDAKRKWPLYPSDSRP